MSRGPSAKVGEAAASGATQEARAATGAGRGPEVGNQAVQADMLGRAQRRLGVAPASVRIQRDSAGVGVTGRLGARAAASGDRVVLGPGADRISLAHELIHVAQAQRFGPAAGKPVSASSDPAEREARRMAPQLLSGEGSLAVRERPQALWQRDEPGFVIVPVAGTGEPLAAYGGLKERLSPGDWNALNAAARRRADKILTGAASKETGEAVKNEVTVELDSLFEPRVTESRATGRTQWLSDMFSWGIAGGGAATTGMAATLRTEILHRWLNANPGILMEQVTIALVDPEGKGGGAAAALTFSLRGHPVPPTNGLLTLGAVDSAIDGGAEAMLTEISAGLSALAVAVEKAGTAQAMLKSARDVAAQGHDKIAAGALDQIDAGLRGGLASIDSIKDDPFSALVQPTATELRTFVDGGFASFRADHAKWRAANPRSSSLYEDKMKSAKSGMESAEKLMQGSFWDRLFVGQVIIDAQNEATNASLQNMAMGNAPEQGRQLGLAYDMGVISYDSWSKGVAAADRRGWIFGSVTVVLTLATGALGLYVGPSLSFGGNVALGAFTGVVTAAGPMLASNWYTSTQYFGDPMLQQWWQSGAYSGRDIAIASLISGGIGAALPIAGRLLGKLRGQGPLAVALLEAGGPAPEGVVAGAVRKGVVDLKIPSEGVTIRVSAKGYQVIGKAGSNPAAILEEGPWPAVAGQESVLGPGSHAGFAHPKFPTAIGFGDAGWQVLSPRSANPVQFGFWPELALPPGGAVQPASTVSPLLLDAASGVVASPMGPGQGMMVISGMNLPSTVPTAPHLPLGGGGWPSASPFAPGLPAFMAGEAGFTGAALRPGTPLLLGSGQSGFQSSLDAPFLHGVSQMPADALSVKAPALPPWEVLSQSAIPQGLIGPHVPESFKAGMNSQWRDLAQTRVKGSLPDLGPFGEWRMTPSGWLPVWYIFPPGGVPNLSLVTYGTGPGTDFLIDYPGQVKVAISSPRPGGNYRGPRDHPMEAADMFDPVLNLTHGQSHIFPQHMTKDPVAGQVLSSTDPRNFVAVFRKYNEWIRNQMEQKLKREGTPYTVYVVIGPEQRLTTGGYVIPDAEIFIQYGTDGSALKAWRFPLTDPNFYDALGAQGPFKTVLPQFEIDIGAVPRGRGQ